MAILPDSQPRLWRIEVEGFDPFTVEATSREAARYASWRSFREAGHTDSLVAFGGFTRVTVAEQRRPPRCTGRSSLAELAELAAEGLSRSEIAACTGWSVQTIGKRIGHLVPARHLDREPDVERHRRMLRAAESASYGEMDAIAKRFGLKNALVLRVVLVRARRLVAEADQFLGE